MNKLIFAFAILAGFLTFNVFARENVVQFDRSFDQMANSSREFGYAGADKNALALGLVSAIQDGKQLCSFFGLPFLSVAFGNTPNCEITTGSRRDSGDAICHMQYKVYCIQFTAEAPVSTPGLTQQAQQ